MARDNKYGYVTLEKGTIGEDEPVVVFRAQDGLLLNILDLYFDLCEEVGSPSRHLELIRETTTKVREWQYANPTKIPTSDPPPEK